MLINRSTLADTGTILVDRVAWALPIPGANDDSGYDDADSVPPCRPVKVRPCDWGEAVRIAARCLGRPWETPADRLGSRGLVHTLAALLCAYDELPHVLVSEGDDPPVSPPRQRMGP